MKRKIEVELAAWRRSKIRKPLIIRGARQVGKTSVVRNFAHDNFSQLVEINLEKKEHHQMFDPSISVDDFLQRVNLMFDKKAESGKTLLFIDEIQESQNVMELLRFFAEEKPDLHVIAAGSLLEAKMGSNWTMPVGRVEYMYLYPLTFFEYLQAKGKEKLGQELQKITWGKEVAASELAGKLYGEYLRIGGMPEVVANFVERNDYGEVREILSRLRIAYIDDIAKYAKSVSEKKYLELVVEYGPKMAGGLFKYENFGGSLYRSREMGEAIGTIEKVRLLTQVKAVNSTSLPLTYKDKRAKKMIWLDVGMVNEVNNIFQDMMRGVYQGRIMEQMVGQTLIAGGTRKPVELGYWARNRDEGSAEVDFCFQYGEKIIGMEVKSGNMREMKSLFSMVESGGGKVIPVRMSWDGLGIEKYHYSGREYKILSIPFYLLERWEELMAIVKSSKPCWRVKK